MRSKIVLLFLLIRYSGLHAGNIIIDAQIQEIPVISGHLKMGNPGPPEKEILINSRYMTIGGKPVVPVMGEVHFSRISRSYWEDIILKMKANGINIIAFYVIWIHHEEIEGQFNWEGNKDLRYFIKLCKENNMLVFPRIGPWCHGEVRNGGTPDWILSKTYLKDRSNHPVYQYYADRWYEEIAKQLKGYLYKDGGPVIGVQFENEYRRGQGGEAHIMWLKEAALKHGIDVPVYTVTGWGNASVPQDEVIPLWGGYPSSPWTTNILPLKENLNFTFESPMNDPDIGNEAVKRNRSYIKDYSHYPYFTCELGVGNQISYHRRPVLSSVDGLAIAIAKTGSGSNLPGYYVFAGGSNPAGIYNTIEENQDETAYWNEYPDISYDFQAAIRETGELALSYHKLKSFHYFLNEFGNRLAPMEPVISKETDSKKELQYAVRVHENSGFIFIMNYYRGETKPVQKNIKFNISLENEIISFPEKPVDIVDSSIMIWPFNFKMDGVNLKYASAQPLCKIKRENETFWFFISSKNIKPEFCFDKNGIENIEVYSAKINKREKTYYISEIMPGLDKTITCKSDNQIHHIVVFSYSQTDNLWLLNNKQLFISDNNLYMNNSNNIHVFGKSSNMKILSFNKINQPASETRQDGVFTEYTFHSLENPIHVNYEKRNILDNVAWLKTSVDEINDKNSLYHKIFIKEIDLGNPSKIKSATLYLYSVNNGRIKINERWINSEIIPGKLNNVDVTGYFNKGNNFIMADFPFSDSEGSFAARIIIEYFNSDRFEIKTDNSWLTTEQYIIPVPGNGIKNLTSPDIVVKNNIFEIPDIKEWSEWEVYLIDYNMNNQNKLYMDIDYIGDMARCYVNNKLVADNFNNGTIWGINLQNFEPVLNGDKLIIQIFPLRKNYKIYFDIQPEIVEKADLKKIEIIPEYKVIIPGDSNK